MPRISKGSSDEREAFMLEIFKKNPSLSVGKANEEFKKKFGSMLRNKRAYELRRVASTGTTVDPNTAKRPVAANGHRPVTAAREPSGGADRPAALITGSPDQIAFLKTALDQLWQDGLVGVKVDHTNSTETAAYAVVAKA